MYRSLAWTLFNKSDDATVHQLCANIAWFMRMNPVRFEAARRDVARGEVFARHGDFCDAVRNGTVCGNHAVLQACADVYRVRIQVLSCARGGSKTNVIAPRTAGLGDAPIVFLGHYSEFLYDGIALSGWITPTSGWNTPDCEEDLDDVLTASDDEHVVASTVEVDADFGSVRLPETAFAMLDPTELSIEIVLVVTSEVAFSAVLRLMIPLRGQQDVLQSRSENEIYRHKVSYHVGLFGAYTAALVQESGIASAIRLWKPIAVIKVGVGYGLRPNDQNIGDVLVSAELGHYDLHIGDDGSVDVVQPGLSSQPDPHLAAQFDAAATRGWRFELTEGGRCSTVFRGLLLSGSPSAFVYSGPHTDISKSTLLRSYRDALGGEFCAENIASMCFNNTAWMVVNGICEFGGSSQRNSIEVRQSAAAAASLVQHVLSDRPLRVEWQHEPPADAKPMSIKLLVVGDRDAGKEELLIVYTTNRPLGDYSPAVFDACTARVMVDGKRVDLRLEHSTGVEEFSLSSDRLRLGDYGGTDVILLCYSVISRKSFRHVSDLWYPLLSHYCPNIPILLVGTKVDLCHVVEKGAELLSRPGLAPISPEQGLAKQREIRAVKYMECSARTQYGVKEVFDQAVRAVPVPVPVPPLPFFKRLRQAVFGKPPDVPK
jgi:Ras-related C3 botulinum toxin substrate 1